MRRRRSTFASDGRLRVLLDFSSPSARPIFQPLRRLVACDIAQLHSTLPLLPPSLFPLRKMAPAAGENSNSTKMKAPPSFSTLFSIGPAQEALFSTLTRVELLLSVRTLCTECRDWVDAELLHAGVCAVRLATWRRGSTVACCTTSCGSRGRGWW